MISADEATMDASAAEFVKINKAKDILLDRQKRTAFDHYGMSGVEMLSQSDAAEVRSLRVGKRYRNDGAVKELLQYYFRRELSGLNDKEITHTRLDCLLR